MVGSFWEILNPSNLEYNRQLGVNQDDSGFGPPSHEVVGWVRTGYVSTFASTPGEANCDNWSEGSASYYGTLARLPKDWEDGAVSDMSVWDVNATLCNSPLSVWCVADVVGHRLYMAIVRQ